MSQHCAQCETTNGALAVDGGLLGFGETRETDCTRELNAERVEPEARRTIPDWDDLGLRCHFGNSSHTIIGNRKGVVHVLVGRHT